MKILIVCILTAAAVMTGCKKKEPVLEPAFIMNKWAKAVKDWNYHAYAECEAYPLSSSAFKDKYQDYYIQDVMVVKIGDVDEKRILADHEGKKHIRRLVSFEAAQYLRKDHTPAVLLRGDVEFRKYHDSSLSAKGWVMANKTIIKIDK